MEKVSKKIKVIGFIMTCFMVFYHCGDYDNSSAIGVADSWFNKGFNYVFSIMGSVVMAWFFTVTGFLLMHGLTFTTYPQKIKRRCFSLLIPYVIWQILTLIHNIIAFHSHYSIKDFLYLSFAFVQWPFDGALWYVYAVFILAVLSPILLILFRNKNIGFVILMCIIVLIQYRENISNSTFQAVITYGLVPNLLRYLPAYLLGAFYGKFYDELKTSDSLIYVLLVLLASRLLFFADFDSMALIVLPILGIYLIPNITKAADLKIYKLTFLIYALHQTVIGDLRVPVLNFLSSFIPAAVFVNIISRLVLLTANILLSAIIYIALRKICPILLSLLTGGRAEPQRTVPSGSPNKK